MVRVKTALQNRSLHPYFADCTGGIVIEVEKLKVYIIGADTDGSGQLLASPYMEKELRTFGFELEKIPAADAHALRRAFIACAQPQTLLLCPLSGNLNADTACIRAAAEVCQKELEPNEQLMQHLIKRGHLSEQEAADAAVLPQGARAFSCRQSLLPGFELMGEENFHILVLPANPEEQTSLFFSYLFQVFNKICPTPCQSRVLRIMEMSFEQVQEALSDLLEQPLPCVAIYEKRSEVIIRISDNNQNRQQAVERCAGVMREIASRLGDHVYGIDVNGIEHALALKCAKKNIRLAFAESGSAGLAAKRFHAVDKDGQLVYSVYQCQPEEMELERLGINDKICKKFGPVSANVAAAMALGVSKQEEQDLWD